MKKILLFSLLAVSTQVSAMSGGVTNDGTAYFEYHHTIKINGQTLYCDNKNDCRTKEAWFEYMNNPPEEVIVYQRTIGEREAINRHTTSEIVVKPEPKKESNFILNVFNPFREKIW